VPLKGKTVFFLSFLLYGTGGNVSPDEMVQNATFYAIDKTKERVKRNPKMAFVKEGPYAVPLIS